MFGKILRILVLGCASFIMFSAEAQSSKDYQLAAGDVIHILVFQNPDLTLDTRVSEDGTINYPLIGTVLVSGISISEASSKIAHALEAGGFVKGPQVNISIVQIVGNQVSVLGFVNRAGSYPLLTFTTHLTQILATAGGIVPGPMGGSMTIILSGIRDGKPITKRIDVAAIYLENRPEDDVILSGGDSIFVPKAPMFYIYGQVNRPGQYPIERGMTLMEALATGGGPTLRGTERRMRVTRRSEAGDLGEISPNLSDPVKPDDVIYINESLF